MMTSRLLTVFIAFSFVFTGLPGGAVAQQTTGTIAGRVLDPSGAVVPNAVVVVRSARGEVTSSTTDAAGRFAVPAVAAGKAEVTVDGAGFSPVVREATVVAGQQTRVDVGLELGVLTESVRVVPE